MTSISASAAAKRVLEKRVEIIKDKFYWISDSVAPSGFDDSFYFCVDHDLTYTPYHKDFGPLHLGNIYKYVTEVEKLLTRKTSPSTVLYHYTSTCSAKKTNSCLLVLAYQVIVGDATAEEAWRNFMEQDKVEVHEFIEAGYKPNQYRCSVLDCLRGLEYAIKLGWFHIAKFNIKEYQHYERVENGDLNWIVPGKFLAFSSPNDAASNKGHKFFTGEALTPVLKKLGVKMVVRLNDPLYDEKVMVNSGIDHVDIFFEDGSCPGPHHIQKFLAAAENCQGAVGVHCKAGLGRTGTLIGLYLMKHYKIPAPALIGWMRLCRPGMVLGNQQFFLCKMQAEMFRESAKSRVNRVPINLARSMSKVALETEIKFDDRKMPTSINYYLKEENQADRLLRMKDEHRNPERPKSVIHHERKPSHSSKTSIYAAPRPPRIRV